MAVVRALAVGVVTVALWLFSGCQLSSMIWFAVVIATLVGAVFEEGARLNNLGMLVAFLVCLASGALPDFGPTLLEAAEMLGREP